jgi:16S rRNA (guanine966-N2)-methyltransferase
MRIIGGQARGRRLAPLQGLNIRPTSDRVKEAIFNLIGQDLTDMLVLDLFAGTGNLGIEALSRGASHCVFVDNSLQAIRQIQKNLDQCGYQEQATVIRKDLSGGLPEKLLFNHARFDLVFLDPPYSKGLIENLLTQISGQKILASGAQLIAESSKRDPVPEPLGPLRMIKLKSYGDTKITIYQSV